MRTDQLKTNGTLNLTQEPIWKLLKYNVCLTFFPLEFHVQNKIYKSYILSWSLHKILYNQSRSTCKKGKSMKIFSVSTQFNELDNSLRFYCPRGSGAVDPLGIQTSVAGLDESISDWVLFNMASIEKCPDKLNGR